MNEQDAIDYWVDQAKEAAKEARHEARYTITLTGTEANLIMNYLRDPYSKPGSPAQTEIETLRKRFGKLYFWGEWESTK